MYWHITIQPIFIIEIFRTLIKSFSKRFAFNSIIIYILTDIKSCINFIELNNKDI